MPFTVSLKEHLEMFELRKFLLRSVLLKIECFVAVKTALEIDMMIMEALNTLVSLVPCTYVHVLNHSFGAS